MQLLHERVERSLLRIFLMGAGAVVTLVLLAFAATRGYRHWQESRLYGEARALISRGDFQGAGAPARRAFVLNPESVEANRLLARISDHANSRAGLDYWRRAADLSTNNPADLLAWTQSAIRARDLATADAALSRWPASAQNSAQYHALRGDVALLRGDVGTFEAEITQAMKLEPQNHDYALALATLHTASESRHAQGVAELEELSKNDATRHAALRRLAEDALRRRDWARAVDLTQRLEALADRSFADRLLALTARQEANDPALTAALAQLQAESAKDPDRVAAIISWMTASGQTAAAVKWSDTLAPELRREKTVPLALADAYVAAKDWKALQNYLRKADWGVADYMRSALLARAARELNQADEFQRQWSDATRKVSANADRTLMLAETAQRWGWETEAIDLLWLAAKDPGKADRTLGSLYRYFAGKGDTRELYRVLLHLAELHPQDRAIQNNVAQLALLLGFDLERAQRNAREVYAADPRNPDFAATYAFALWRAGDPKKARQILDQLSEREKNRPAIAAYYGIILAANGDVATAKQYLSLSDRAGLLPEEKQLVEKARAEIAGR